MPCTCHHCGSEFSMDLVAPDDLWEKIKPEGKPEGAGLLCPTCIVKRVEALHKHSAYQLCHIDSTDQ